MTKPYNILAINGSHRTDRGISEVLLNRFLEGSRTAGATTNVIYSSRMDIAPCRACYRCITRTPGVCFQKDDMERTLCEIQKADLLLLAAPVYFDTMPSDMKRLFERLMPTLGPVFEFRDGRTYHLTTGTRFPDTVTILLSGNPERESLTSISKTFRRIVKNMGGHLKGEFLFPSSQMAVDHADHLRGQLDALERAGREIVVHNSIGQETLEMANREYISDMMADIESKNRAFAKMMKQNGLNNIVAG